MSHPFDAQASAPDGNGDPAQRLARRYRFTDADMDLFFVAALGWGPSGGLSVGEAFHVGEQIVDGDADSWVDAFAGFGEQLEKDAQDWAERGHRRIAGETRLKAFASFRSAWQFAGPGQRFLELVARHRTAFREALAELDFPVSFFEAPFEGHGLPGLFLHHPDPAAPTALVIGGADTCFEDLFLTLGRSLFERGYSVAIADLPGQGATQADGMHWQAEAEKPIGAIMDLLVEEFGAQPGRIGLIGLSLGGYFVARAAGHEHRLGTVIASTPFPSPAQLFKLSVEAAVKATEEPVTQAALRSRATSLWKAGAHDPRDFVARTRGMVADPALVTLPFLSILGEGDSPVFAAQAHTWHESIRSSAKKLVLLDAGSGADGHVQVANRARLAQECSAWMDEIFAR